jgi:hypothetical protein
MRGNGEIYVVGRPQPRLAEWLRKEAKLNMDARRSMKERAKEQGHQRRLIKALFVEHLLSLPTIFFA